ncbi:hypothetical protein [Alicyclobacillus macrosporangiidus]|uniref:Uncharacterized protein n=1 Tax=Alicyclobacillus macrosporangiidus TaxID=392015 RepID=A0A1I7ICM7_9BACL|nr:hypothetical protein [Alicyclobacillus macrosporangiidus]SFU70661.1 hypothetical protein SAMN05421543_106134 [Alicyclobacillus macrosporangiidus]
MTSAYDDIADPRARAEAIIGQMRLQRMEQSGLAVVDRSRLEALEHVANAAQDLIDQCWTRTEHGPVMLGRADLEPLADALEALGDAEEAMER